MQAEHTQIQISPDVSVSALLLRPRTARALYVLAHGAGAGMSHPFLEGVSQQLATRGIATLRFNFEFMNNLDGKRWARPDPPARAQRAVRAAAAHARVIAPDLPLFVGGKSFGARITSLAQAEQPLGGAIGLIFWASRCILQKGRLRSALNILRLSGARCSSFRERATPWLIWL